MSLGIQGAPLDIQGGGPRGGVRGWLAGHGDSPGSQEGWRPAQPVSPGTHGTGGSWKTPAGTGVRAVSGEAGLASSGGADVMSWSALTCAAHPAQYRGDPPSGFPQFGQTRMGAPWLRHNACD